MSAPDLALARTGSPGLDQAIPPAVTAAAGAPPPARPSLRIANVAVGYGRKRVIDGLSVAPLRPGTLTALVGPNGAGKSTLLRSLAGLVPGEGQLFLGEHDLRRMPLAERAKHVSFMPQGLPQGVALTVIETLIGALRAVAPASGPVTDEEATHRGLALLERLGIAHLALRGLDRLSGGQRQLAGLAQALIREPGILMLDEPTSALDLRFQLTVMNLVRDTVRRQGLIGIVVLHDLALAARFSDRVMVLHGGRVHADGDPATELTPPLLAEVYGVQARVERCSLGHLLVLADEALPQVAPSN